MATKAELEAEIARLRAAQRGKPEGLTFKVGQKGGVSVSGLGQRFPATLYADQWELILDHADDLRKFIAANQDSLKRK